jgi:hypothetical protein
LQVLATSTPAQMTLGVTRHARMLDLTGTDAAALPEARTALDRIAAHDHPDLGNGVALGSWVVSLLFRGA